MRKSKFTESQIVSLAQEGEAGVPVAEMLRKHGIRRPLTTRGGQVRRASVRAAPAEGAAGGERQAKADVCPAAAEECRR